MSLSVEYIRAIATLCHDDIDLPEEAIPSEMTIKLCINTLTFEHMTHEEQSLGYFARKKLKILSTCQQWKDRETKKIDQFYTPKMFRDSIDPIGLPKSVVILHPHWQYAVKWNGTCCLHMCCNGSKNAASKFYAMNSTWSSCV